MASALCGCASTADQPPPAMADAETCIPNAANDALEREHLMIGADYYNRGHVKAQVDPPVVRGDRACFMVHPGPRYRIATLHVVDRDQQPGDALGDPAALSAMLHARSGDWFARDIVVSDLQGIRTRYRNAGYYSVVTDPETALDDSHTQMSLDIAIRRGPITTIERIDITGNQRVAEETIRNALLVKVGDRYHEGRLQETTDRLKSLGVFRDVELRTDLVTWSDDRLAITVDVKEK